MNPERWRIVKSIALEALSLSPDDRERYIEERCTTDPDLKERVRSLFATDADSLGAALRADPPSVGGPNPDLSGERIGRYQVLDAVGEGGMGVVYKAQDITLGRLVALKFLHARLGGSADARKRFEREARAAATLDHPNICTVYEADQADSRMFIAMALLDGWTLEQRLADGAMTAAEALNVAIQACAGLAAAHARDIVHRDLKPANVMLLATPPGFVKLLDFGLASVRHASTLTAEGARFGTIAYMSPEQVRGDPVDGRTDIWSMGVLLYEMLGQRRPFRGHFDEAVIYSILHEQPEPLSSLRPDLPQQLSAILTKALQKDPRKRYARIDDLHHDLENARADLAVSSPPHPSKRPAAAKWGAALLALAALALLAGVSLDFGAQPVAPASPLDASGQRLRLSPLADIPGVPAWPAFSPDGDRLAFAWDGAGEHLPGNSRDIYIKTISSGERVRLSSYPEDEENPTWSPSGDAIAWLRIAADDSPDPCEVLQANADGGPATSWGRYGLQHGFDGRSGVFGRYCSPISWTGDGTHVVSAQKYPAGLIILSPDDRPRGITAPVNGWDSQPTISPDGQTLAFLRHNETRLESAIFVVDVRGDGTPTSEPRKVSQDDSLVWSMSWTPDGSALIYVGGGRRGTRRALWLQPIAPGSERRRLSDATNVFSVAVDRSDGKLAFSRGVVEHGFSRIAIDPETGALGDPEPFGPKSGDNCCLRFSPDGSQLAFSAIRDLYSGIFIADRSGDSTRVLHSDSAANVFDPEWSPDGSTIAMTLENWRKPGIWSIHTMPAAGGSLSLISIEGEPSYRASWAPDGQSLYYGSNRSGRPEIWRQSPGEPPVQITEAGGMQALPSADGRFLYFMKAVGGPLYRIPSQGGAEELVANSVWRTSFNILGNTVYYVVPGPGPTSRPFRIERFSPDGRTETVKTLPDNHHIHEGPEVSEAAGFMVYSYISRFESEILLVDDIDW